MSRTKRMVTLEYEVEQDIALCDEPGCMKEAVVDMASMPTLAKDWYRVMHGDPSKDGVADYQAEACSLACLLRILETGEVPL